MGTTKPRVEHFAPLMNRVKRQLIAISSMLTQAGKLQLVNSVLSSLPTYNMCSVAMPIAILESFDRARRHCIWRNSDCNAKSKLLVAWKKCTKPKRRGGLGIINLRSQNTALLLKHLDKFYNKRDIPWVNLIWNIYYGEGEVPHATKDKGSFWWKDLVKLCDIYRGIAKCTVGDGTTVLFWSDIWNDHLLQDKFPRFFSFAKNKLISVAKFLGTTQMEELFHLPLSNEAWQEYQALQDIIQGIQITEGEKDCWKYIWGKSEYSSSKFYNLHFNSIEPPRPFIWIWDSKCSNKIRVFGWLLLMDRLNVRNIL
jgi:hypothetical protein